MPAVFEAERHIYILVPGWLQSKETLVQNFLHLLSLTAVFAPSTYKCYVLCELCDTKMQQIAVASDEQYWRLKRPQFTLSGSHCLFI